jgi:hypothetical protein
MTSHNCIHDMPVHGERWAPAGAFSDLCFDLRVETRATGPQGNPSRVLTTPPYEISRHYFAQKRAETSDVVAENKSPDFLLQPTRLAAHLFSPARKYWMQQSFCSAYS